MIPDRKRLKIFFTRNYGGYVNQSCVCRVAQSEMGRRFTVEAWKSAVATSRQSNTSQFDP